MFLMRFGVRQGGILFETLIATHLYKTSQSAFTARGALHTEMRDGFDPPLFRKFALLFSE
jgi:hypothetical protein